MRISGILLLVVGILMMVFTGFNFTEKDKVVDIGPLEINKTEEHKIGWPVYVGGIVAVAGIVLVVAGGKKD